MLTKAILSIAQRIAPYSLNRVPEPSGSIDQEEIIEGNLQDGREGALAVVYAIILELLSSIPLSGSQALDVGVGTGVLLDRIIHQVIPDWSILAVDLSPAMLEKARQTIQSPKTRFTQTNVLSSEFKPSERFDLITANLMLHHLPDLEAVDKFITKLYSLLNPTGILFIFDIERPKTQFIAEWTAKTYNNRWNRAYF